jgi:hypothetical protein
MSDVPHPESQPVAPAREVHHGTFAEGESDPKAFPEDTHAGTFDEAEARP